MNDAIIKISELKKNTRILLETEDTVFEISVVSPKSGSLDITGGMYFPRNTKVVISDKKISKGDTIEFTYKTKKSSEKFKTSKVVSAKVYGHDNSWEYDAIEKNENTNKT